ASESAAGLPAQRRAIRLEARPDPPERHLHAYQGRDRSGRQRPSRCRQNVRDHRRCREGAAPACQRPADRVAHGRLRPRPLRDGAEVTNRDAPGKVLVVDDDPEIVTFLSTLLELEGIESSVATSAAAALEQLQQGRPDLVLLDIAMPDRDGIDLCKELKSDPRLAEVPVFVVSARPGKDVVDRALAAGAEEFIRKPFENAELISRIRVRLSAND